jgi:hypothetical protein
MVVYLGLVGDKQCWFQDLSGRDMQARLTSQALTRVLEGLVMRVGTFRALLGCVLHATFSARVKRCDVLAFEPIEHYTQACFPSFDWSWLDRVLFQHLVPLAKSFT